MLSDVSSPGAVFDALDEHTVPVMVLCTVAMIGNYIWFISAYRTAKRDRTYPIPVFLLFFWFAHDSSFVLKFDTWFNTYDHWFPKLFWALITLTVVSEIIFIAQTVKYGKEELAPRVTEWQWRLGLLGGCAAMFVAWAWLKQSMDDPIYLDIFALTVLSYPGVAIMTLLRRRTRRGMSMTMCGGFLMMTVFYFGASSFLFGPDFQSTTYYLVGGASLAMALAMTWLTWRMPEYVPEAGPDAGRATEPAVAGRV
ncbi:hypothetical protein ASD11_00565 [Aeromicrobium sp. Root495]|uniref:transmembrane-type terpene cyclase n=1 Tax=Aeromicrobium sp. Root495 TaxID=1736550 RepID=UPI0006F8E0E1|nr:hypothetical protein [Aeromicrobium sp. Root495]KQY58197.1 hypothetical protein ASD11_00565 [Aeromicrobium sp. Root495]